MDTRDFLFTVEELEILVRRCPDLLFFNGRKRATKIKTQIPYTQVKVISRVCEPFLYVVLSLIWRPPSSGRPKGVRLTPSEPRTDWSIRGEKGGDLPDFHWPLVFPYFSQRGNFVYSDFLHPLSIHILILISLCRSVIEGTFQIWWGNLRKGVFTRALGYYELYEHEGRMKISLITAIGYSYRKCIRFRGLCLLQRSLS